MLTLKVSQRLLCNVQKSIWTFVEPCIMMSLKMAKVNCVVGDKSNLIGSRDVDLCKINFYPFHLTQKLQK